MNLSLYLARRLFRGEGGEADKRQASLPAIRIATLGVALGLAVMLLSVAVAQGFKQEIGRKVAGFSAHVELVHTETLYAPDARPLIADSALVAQIKEMDGVANAARISSKMGLIKTHDAFKGVTLKGIEAGYDTTFIAESLCEGRLPRNSQTSGRAEVVVSQQTADELGLHVGEKVYAYFFENTIKTRRLEIVGIYKTNLKIFDDLYVLTDLPTVNRLNSWDENQCSIIEVRLDNPDKAESIMPALNAAVKKMAESDDITPIVLNVQDHYPQIFSWLDLLDVNIWIVLILMLGVAGFTMVSGLFILILERTQTIGLLKALGATNARIRYTFLWLAVLIIGRGLLLGNVIALVIIMIQQQWGIIHLDPDKYYMDTVPLLAEPWAIIALNIGTLLLTVLTLVAPSYLISRIQPAKAIRFD